MPGKEQEITQISNTITIKGDIIGKSDVRVAGVVNGSISIDGELIVEKSGHIEGEIKTKQLIIQEGAMFQGNCQMGIPSTPAAQPKEKA